MPALVPLIGKVISGWEVVERLPCQFDRRGGRIARYLLRCPHCGAEIRRRSQALLRKDGGPDPCVCQAGLKGRFGRLVVIRFTGRADNDTHYRYLCQCDCGRQVQVRATRLKAGAHMCRMCAVAEYRKVKRGNMQADRIRHASVRGLPGDLPVSGIAVWELLVRAGVPLSLKDMSVLGLGRGVLGKMVRLLRARGLVISERIRYKDMHSLSMKSLEILERRALDEIKANTGDRASRGADTIGDRGLASQPASHDAQ